MGAASVEKARETRQRLRCTELHIHNKSDRINNQASTIVASDKDVPVGLLQRAIDELLCIFQGDVHISIQAHKDTLGSE